MPPRLALRTAALVLMGALAVSAAGCTPSSPTTSASASVDFTQPGVAEKTLQELQAASGSTTLLKVSVKRDDAYIVVLDADKKARTWQMRDGKPSKVDGDTAYIGQATFRLADYDLHDIGALFTHAAQLSGSAQQQELQIVDYDAATPYMLVTTTPESQTVFFRADGVPVPVLDMATVEGFSAALADVCRGQLTATAVGYSPADGVWLEYARATGSARVVRQARFPARTEVRTTTPAHPAFSPSVVSAATLHRLVTQVDPQHTGKVSIVIDRRDGMKEPTMTVTSPAGTVVTDLGGNDITAQVNR